MSEVVTLHALLSHDQQLVIERGEDEIWLFALNGKCPIPGQPIRLLPTEDPKRQAYDMATKHLLSKAWAKPLKTFEELSWH